MNSASNAAQNRSTSQKLSCRFDLSGIYNSSVSDLFWFLGIFAAYLFVNPVASTQAGCAHLTVCKLLCRGPAAGIHAALPLARLAPSWPEVADKPSCEQRARDMHLWCYPSGPALWPR